MDAYLDELWDRSWKYGPCAVAGVEAIQRVVARAKAIESHRRRACWIMLRPSNQRVEAATAPLRRVGSMLRRPFHESKQGLNGRNCRGACGIGAAGGVFTP